MASGIQTAQKHFDIDDFFVLLRSSISTTDMVGAIDRQRAARALPEIFSFAQEHDLAHLIYIGLTKEAIGQVENEYTERFKRQMIVAMYRHERIEAERQQLYHALEQGQIPFIPLKGSVIQAYYPEAWMRTCCDIDILVQKKDLTRAVSCVTALEGHSEHETSSHDVKIATPNHIMLELHFSLIEEGRIEAVSEVLDEVWESAVLKEGYTYWYEMSDAMFYLYHLSHMAKHLKRYGGCGVRSMIDLWLLNSLPNANHEERKKLVDRGGIAGFQKAISEVCQKCFNGVQIDGETKRVLEYLLEGGAHGTRKHEVSIQMRKKEKWFRVLWEKAFLPYDLLVTVYPIVGKHRWLLPFAWIHRLLVRIWSGKAWERVKETIEGATDSDETDQILNRLGL